MLVVCMVDRDWDRATRMVLAVMCIILQENEVRRQYEKTH